MAGRGGVGRHGEEEQLLAIQTVLVDIWSKMENKWTIIGYDAEAIQNRKNKVQRHVTDLLQDMDGEVEVILSEQKAALESLKAELIQLAKELTMDGTEIQRAIGQASKMSLLEAEQSFLEIASGLRQRKAIRMDKYNSINDRVKEMSEEMGDQPYTTQFEGIPSDCQVAKLEQHLSELHREKKDRQQRLNRFRKSITALFDCVERIPKNELERIVSDDQPVANSTKKVLSTAVLHDLEQLEFALKQQVRSNAEEGEEVWQKIRDLWSRLSVDEELRIAFEKVHHAVPYWNEDKKELTYKPSVLKGLKNELSRLEEEKRRNMSLFITQVREELADLWTIKCFMEKVESRFRLPNYKHLTAFTEEDFISDLYTEELLQKHEMEVTYWRSFVDRNSKIIDGFIKRGEQFNQYKALDEKSDDPARLANRGGALLKEEKERKKLEKMLPKLERELKQMAKHFEEGEDDGHGMRKFLVFGKDISELIETDWIRFHEEKDRRKESRKKPVAESHGMATRTMMTTQLGAPGASRKRPATPSSAQRGGIGVSTPVKRNKMATTPFAHPHPPTSSTKKPVQSNSRMYSRIPSGKPPAGTKFFAPPQSKNTVLAARKLLRKSMGRSRNNPKMRSLISSSSSGGSYDFSQFADSRINELSMDFPKLAANDFPRASTARHILTPTMSGMKGRTAGSKIPFPKGKEQVDPVVNSPDSTYSDFTVPLMCQSTLNSSAVSLASRKPLPLD